MLAVESRKKHARFCKSERFAEQSVYGECNGGQIVDKKRVGQIKEQFDLVIHSDQEAHIEFWYARDLMPLLAMNDGRTLIRQSGEPSNPAEPVE